MYYTAPRSDTNIVPVVHGLLGNRNRVDMDIMILYVYISI
jgi:hypothetical protein